jgi:hypothetical protein
MFSFFKKHHMKLKNLLFVIPLFCYCLLQAAPSPTLKEQLLVVNPYWVFSQYDDDALHQCVGFSSDVALIQTHLLLVEKVLSEKKPLLSAKQARNRANCLEILKKYAQNGIFPINLYHQNRTPYFIDYMGTACAVGHLIIETGYGNLAKKIAKENNYAYIKDLKYPELSAWADEFGFEIEELKWIQPTYPCVNEKRCVIGKITHVSAIGMRDGCIGVSPTPTKLLPPYVSVWFRQSTNLLNWDKIIQPCDLGVGKYKCTLTDINGNTEDFIYTIEVETTKTIDNQLSDFSIFPNPSQDDITIKTNTNLPLSLTLYNMLGQSILSKYITDNQIVISIENLEKGFYNVVISDGKNTLTRKFVKY